MAPASPLTSAKIATLPRLARGSLTLSATAPRPPRASARCPRLARGSVTLFATAPRRGATLIELVMVVSLLVILAAIAIPSLNLAGGQRGIREAARNVNVYLSAARNRAMATGRPVGVALQRFENNANVCFVLERVEARPPYAGDTINSRAQVYFEGSDLKAELSGFSADMVRSGDRIQFDHQGAWYEIDTLDEAEVTLKFDSSRFYPWPNDPGRSRPMSYQIQRQPLTSENGFYVSITRPVQLPIDSVIDLGFSGVGNGSDATLFASGGDMSPVIIMFSPSGGLDSVYVGGVRHTVTEPVFLLIGKREHIPPAQPEDANWQDGESLWVYVSPQTGMVNTVEVANDTSLAASRELAWQAETMGGR